VVFTDRIVLIALAVGIYRQTISVGKYQGNPSRSKKILKNQKARWHVIFCGRFYRKNYSWIQTEKVV
jgi:hypothetical protein